MQQLSVADFKMEEALEAHRRVMAANLLDYRCECGKLLFKGVLTLGVLESKCKKCGRLNKFQQSKHRLMPTNGYAFMFSPNGMVREVSPNAFHLLGYEFEEMFSLGYDDLFVGTRENRGVIEALIAYLNKVPDIKRCYFQHKTLIKNKAGDVLVCTARWRFTEEGQHSSVIYLFPDRDPLGTSYEKHEFMFMERYPVFSAEVTTGGSCLWEPDHAYFVGEDLPRQASLLSMIRNPKVQAELAERLIGRKSFFMTIPKIKIQTVDIEDMGMFSLANRDKDGTFINYMTLFAYRPDTWSRLAKAP